MREKDYNKAYFPVASNFQYELYLRFHFALYHAIIKGNGKVLPLFSTLDRDKALANNLKDQLNALLAKKNKFSCIDDSNSFDSKSTSYINSPFDPESTPSINSNFLNFFSNHLTNEESEHLINQLDVFWSRTLSPIDNSEVLEPLIPVSPSMIFKGGNKPNNLDLNTRLTTPLQLAYNCNQMRMFSGLLKKGASPFKLEFGNRLSDLDKESLLSCLFLRMRDADLADLSDQYMTQHYPMTELLTLIKK